MEDLGDVVVGDIVAYCTDLHHIHKQILAFRFQIEMCGCQVPPRVLGEP